MHGNMRWVLGLGRDVVWGLWAGERCMDEIHLGGGEVGSVSEGTKEGRGGRRTTLTYVMVFPGQAQVVDWPPSSSVWMCLGGTLTASEDPGGTDAALQLRPVQAEGVARIQGGGVVVREESIRRLVDELGRGVVDMINWIVDDGIHAGLVWWRRGGCRGVLVMVPGGEGDCRVERTMWRVLRECERVIVGRIVH